MAGTQTQSQSGAKRSFVPIAVLVLGAVCVYKISKVCSIKVHPKCVTVVYDTRRKAVLCTSADSEMRNEDLPRVEHFSALFYLSRLSIYCSRSLIIVPPSSFFGVFTLPRSVFHEPGEATDCTVENVKVTDGTVDMILTIYYMIPFELLERYLAAVGPQAPNEIIAVAAAQIARMRGSEASVGILISKARRDAVFAEPYCSHLATKLMSEAAIRLVNVTFDKVELIHDA